MSWRSALRFGLAWLASVSVVAGVHAQTTSRVVFSRDGDIWMMDDDGSNQTQSTNDAWDDVEPIICQSKIVFASDRADNGTYDLWSMNTDGQRLANLTSSAVGDDREPDCDPQSENLTIVFSSTKDNEYGEIYTVPLNGGTITRLTDNSILDKEPTWCGEKIAWIQKQTPPLGQPYDRWNEIYLMKSDGTDGKRMTCDDMEQNEPSCSPDGEHIAHTDRDWINGQPTPATVIYRFPICDPDPDCCPYCCYTDGARTQLTTDGVNNDSPNWSPGGTSIVFSSNRESVDPDDETTDFEVYKMDAVFGDSGEGWLDQLTGGTGQQDDDITPDWGETKP